MEQPTAPGFAGADGVHATCSDRFVRNDPEHLVIDVEAPARGFLVLADQYFPGWRATVNVARLRSIARTTCFASSRCRPASCIEFVDRPTSILIGAAVSALGLAAATELLVQRRARVEAPIKAPVIAAGIGG